MANELTLLEAAKLSDVSRKSGVIQLYAEAYQPMQVAPVLSTGGKASYGWSIEDALAHTSGGKRNVNADYTASSGRVKPYETDMKIYGGKLDIDRYIKKHFAESVTFQEENQIRSYAREFTIDAFEGTGGTSLRGFRDWFSDSAYSNQQVSAGSDASGTLLATTKVDEVISMVDRINGQTFFYCRDIVARRLRYISKGQQSNEQHMMYAKDEFGEWSWMYDGIPIIVLKDGKGTDLLSVTEIDGAATNSDTCSLYLITWAPEMAAFVSSDNSVNGVPVPNFYTMGDGTQSVYEIMEWYVSMAPHRPRCMARVRYIKNAVS